ncbi:MAG TPA: hypothetical protein VM240_09350 [Verrucomicrobiae bacterium]|nr:hypothetical protein [Verrucomicrobiae bacterium]
MKHAVHRIIAIAALGILGACGGGGGGGDGGGGSGLNCAAITGGGTQVLPTLNCAGCTVSNAPAAIDGNTDTYASLFMPAGAGGTLALRATAQEGIVYPAGTPAAVIYAIARSSGNALNTAETITTYLNGAPQQTGNAGSVNNVSGGNVQRGRRAISTVQQFDAIEVTYTQSGGTASSELQVYEFCTSTN